MGVSKRDTQLCKVSPFIIMINLRKFIIFLCIVFVFMAASDCFAETAKQVKWQRYNGGFFTIEIPEGWEVVTAGSCATFSFIIRDPQNPIRRIFYFGEAGPVYLNEHQRQIDYQYMGMNGFPVQWINMPTVQPLTAENFFKQFYLMAQNQLVQNFMPGTPALNSFQVISSVPQRSSLMDADAKVIRALFKEFNIVGEGMFYTAAAPLLPYDGISPGAGIGYGFCCTGVSSYKKDFKEWEAVLLKSLRSLQLDERYITQCRQMQDKMWNSISEINKIWDDISDIIQESWEYKNAVQDAAAEKWSDAMLGKERLYDPDTGEVYEFEAGFYDEYDLNRGKYKNSDLQPIPNDDYELWSRPTKNGAEAI